MSEPSSTRSSLANMETMQGIIFPFEPEVWRGNVKVNYNEVAPIGGAHAYLDFQHTSNERFSAEFRWERLLLAFAGAQRQSMDDAADKIDKHRAFLKSCTVPGELPDGSVTGETPLLFLDVPGVLAVYCVMESLDWEIPRRAERDRRIMTYRARVTFIEKPQYRYTTQSLLEAGYNRY